MSPAPRAPSGVTFIDLEFDTGTNGGALLGDIASSLVSLDELLRDLASIAAYPSSAEFRKIEIAAIEMRSPLRIRLSLFAISPDAVKAFQEICRHIIVFRERRSRPAVLTASESEDASARLLAGVNAALELCTPQGLEAHITEQEAQRLHGHVVTLQNAAIPMKRIEVKEE
jgi:hypothetical protein